MKSNTKIRKARLVKNLTMRQLAEKVGVTGQTIYNYERGLCRPDEKKFKKLREVLKIKGTRDEWFPSKHREYRNGGPCQFEGGCSRPAIARGLCPKHYARVRNAEYARLRNEAYAHLHNATGDAMGPPPEKIKFMNLSTCAKCPLFGQPTKCLRYRIEQRPNGDSKECRARYHWRLEEERVKRLAVKIAKLHKKQA